MRTTKETARMGMTVKFYRGEKPRGLGRWNCCERGMPRDNASGSGECAVAVLVSRSGARRREQVQQFAAVERVEGRMTGGCGHREKR
jgi:diaminopimelate epimerase